MDQLHAVRSKDVYQWPEFRALAIRLGIDLEKHIREVTIRLDYSGLAEFTVTCVGTDSEEKE